MRKQDLAKIIRKCWSRDTSGDPEEWNLHHPSWYQCEATSLMVQDYLGGDLVRTSVKIPDKKWVSHYYNRIKEKDWIWPRSSFQKELLSLKALRWQ